MGDTVQHVHVLVFLAVPQRAGDARAGRGRRTSAPLLGRDNVKSGSSNRQVVTRCVCVCHDRRAAKTQVFGEFQWPREGVGQPLRLRARRLQMRAALQ